MPDQTYRQPFSLGEAQERLHFEQIARGHLRITGNDCPASTSHGLPAGTMHAPVNGQHQSLTHAAPERDQTNTDARNQEVMRQTDASNHGWIYTRSNIRKPAAHMLADWKRLRSASPRSSSTHTLAGSETGSETMYDDEVETIVWLPTALDAARVNQVQLLSDFLEMHFPTTQAKMSLQQRRSYLTALPDMDLSSVPMLRSAVQAICFAHAGTNHNDDRLVQASQRAYGQVLNSLLRRLDGTNEPTDPRVIVSSIMLLTLYDDTLPKANATGWQAHYWGVQQFLKSAGTSAISMSDPFARLLFVNLRVPMMFLGITKRKAIVLGEPKWLALGNVTGLGATPLGRLYPRGLLVPALLERTDAVLRNYKPDTAKMTMRDISALRGELVSWSSTEATFADKTTKFYTIISTSSDDIFDFTIEEHNIMSANSTFDSMFDFHSFSIASEYSMYWMLGLILDCALLRIMHFRPETEAFIKPRTRAEVGRDATSRANYLCRAAYYWTRTDSQGNLGFANAIVALAEMFFSETSSIKELGWCQSVRVAIHMHDARLRTKQPKTLCRVGDMAVDMAASAKFKTKHIVSDG